MPAACFVVGRAWWGLAGGIGLTLGWNLGYQSVRWIRGRPLSVVLLLSLAGLVLRSSIALILHSARMYFLAPAVMTAVVGLAYIGSAFTSTPLVTRIAAEFVSEQTLGRPGHLSASLLRKGTLFYGCEQVLSAAVSVAMIYRLSSTTYAAVHPVASWLVLAVCGAVALPLFRRDLGLIRSRA